MESKSDVLDSSLTENGSEVSDPVENEEPTSDTEPEDKKYENAKCHLSESYATASRFPKVRGSKSKGCYQIEPQVRPVSQVIGLPQMSSTFRPRRSPRPHTTQHLQMPPEFPALWEERFQNTEPEALSERFQFQRSRSLNPAVSNQFRETNPNPHEDHSTNQRRFTSRSSQRSNDGNNSVGFQRQIDGMDPLRALPMQIQRRLNQEMSGLALTDYFGTGVTVARLQNDNIMEFGMCHVIFMLNPVTKQYWLKAFTKKTRSQEGNIMKFNRLLTANMNLEFCGKTAIIICQSNGKAPLLQCMGEKHMFNFFDEAEASRFSEALNKGRKQIWNHNELNLNYQLENCKRQSLFPRQNGDFGGPEYSYGTPRRGDSMFRPDPRLSITYEQEPVPDYYRDIPREMPNGGLCYGAVNSGFNQPPTLRFSAMGVQLFIKIRTVYTLLGIGEISIIHNPGSYDQLMFLGPRNEVICDHLIYAWNKPKIGQENANWECAWPAAANLLISVNPRQMPTIRELKMMGNQEVVMAFTSALQQSTADAFILARQMATLATYNNCDGEMQPIVNSHQEQSFSQLSSPRVKTQQ